MKLTKEQANVITKGKERDTFLNSGAGSGKTTVLSTWVSHIIKKGLAHPSEILVLTYTTKAAQEMKTRIYNKTKHQDLKELAVGTFHSVFYKVLKEYGKHIGIKRMSYLKDYEAIYMIKKTLKSLDIECSDTNIIMYLEHIERSKNILVTPAKTLKKLKQEQEKTGCMSKDRVVAYKVYNESFNYFWKKKKFDFADILMHTETLLRTKQNIREKLQAKYKYIVVDEAQDVNLAQIKILSHLKNADNNIMCIGDFRQSIYMFRGSMPDFMLKHNEWFNGSQMLNLSNNFRSTGAIVNAANTLISNSRDSIIKKKAVPMNARNEQGEDVQVIKARNEKEEIEFIVDKIKSLMDKGYGYGDFAILSSKHNILEIVSEKLKEIGMPYVMASEKAYWETPEIKRIMGFYFFLDDTDDERYLYDIAINVGLKASQISKIVEYAIDKDISYIEALKTIPTKATKSQREKLLKAFSVCENKSILDSFKYILNEFNIIEHYEEKGDSRGNKALDNISKFLTLIKANIDKDLQTKEDLVDYVITKLDSQEAAKDDKSITLSTIHSSKGLEYKVVFVIAVEKGIIPDFRAETLEEVEEQRRLLYVAMTRAEDLLFLSYARKRKIGDEVKTCSPSFLLDDIGPCKKINLMKEKVY